MLPNCVLIRALLNSLSNDISDRNSSKSNRLREDGSDEIENLRNIRLLGITTI